MTKWKLIRRKGRPYAVRIYLGGKWIERTTKSRRKREAESRAVRIVQREEELAHLELYGWAQFRDRYETEHLSGKARKTLEAFQTAANRLEHLAPVETINDLDAATLSRFALRLRKEGKSEATISAYRSHLLSACRWAVDVELIDRVPRPPRLGRQPAARGRPLTREEAERLAMQLPKVVGPQNAKRWAWNLEALWRSGMRIGETFCLWWQRRDGQHYVDRVDEARPRLVIAAEAEKGNRDRIVPLTPDFVHLLRTVPKAKRRGRVFRWPLSRGDSKTPKTPSKRISRCGELAGVIVGRHADGSAQFATAHDFRRSFGDRWSRKVMPVVLKELMRHESIETTMKYYVGQTADQTADVLWRVAGQEHVEDMLSSIIGAETEGFEPSTV